MILNNWKLKKCRKLVWKLWWQGIDLQQNKISIEFELWMNSRWWNGIRYLLHWRQNERSLKSLAPRLFIQPCLQAQIKENTTGLCVWNSPVTGEFPAQRTSNAEMFRFDDVIMRVHIRTTLWTLGLKLALWTPFQQQQICYTFVSTTSPVLGSEKLSSNSNYKGYIVREMWPWTRD